MWLPDDSLKTRSAIEQQPHHRRHCRLESQTAAASSRRWASASARCRMIPLPDAAAGASRHVFAWRDRDVGVRIDVGAAREKQFDDVGVIFEHRPHERGLAVHVSLALTFAPRSRSSLTASILPVRAAVIRAVSPPGLALFGSTPASSSLRIMAALPLVAARSIGVTP